MGQERRADGAAGGHAAGLQRSRAVFLGRCSSIGFLDPTSRIPRRLTECASGSSGTVGAKTRSATLRSPGSGRFQWRALKGSSHGGALRPRPSCGRSRRPSPAPRPGQRQVEARLDQRRLDRVAAPRQAFVQAVQAPDVVGMLAGAAELAVEAEIRAVDRLGLGDAGPAPAAARPARGASAASSPTARRRAARRRARPSGADGRRRPRELPRRYSSSPFSISSAIASRSTTVLLCTRRRLGHARLGLAERRPRRLGLGDLAQHRMGHRPWRRASSPSSSSRARGPRAAPGR